MRTVIISIVVVLFWGCNNNEPVHTSLVGKKLPSFNIMSKDSTVFSTQQIPEGQPVVLFYFSPNCPYCRAQVEDITAGMDDLKNIKFYMLTPSPYQEMKAFSKQYKIDKYSNISIGVDTANYFPNYFNAWNVPTIAIFNKEKKLNALFVGQLGVQQIREVAEQ